jgi:hypothetical protein
VLLGDGQDGEVLGDVKGGGEEDQDDADGA